MILQVNVLVTGDPSEAEDESYPGVYAHSAKLSRLLEPGEVSPAACGAIAEAVLNSFHEHQSVECLDDFEITVQIIDGSTISEMENSSSHERNLVLYVEHEGKVADAHEARQRSRQQ